MLIFPVHFRNHHAINQMTTIVMEVIMKVIVVKRKNLIIAVQVMKIWMIKVEMNPIIQIMKVEIKIKTLLKKKKKKTFCVCCSHSHTSEIVSRTIDIIKKVCTIFLCFCIVCYSLQTTLFFCLCSLSI